MYMYIKHILIEGNCLQMNIAVLPSAGWVQVGPNAGMECNLAHQPVIN